MLDWVKDLRCCNCMERAERCEGCEGRKPRTGTNAARKKSGDAEDEYELELKKRAAEKLLAEKEAALAAELVTAGSDADVKGAMDALSPEVKAKLAAALNKNSPADQDSCMAKTAADAAARLPERLRRDPAVFLAELPALVTTVAGLKVVVDGARCHPAHPRVQAAVLVALKPLIFGAADWVKANGQTVDSNIGKLFELGALEAALAAMSAHAAERAMQAAAWGMLARLVSPSPHATAICAKFADSAGSRASWARSTPSRATASWCRARWVC